VDSRSLLEAAVAPLEEEGEGGEVEAEAAVEASPQGLGSSRVAILSRLQASGTTIDICVCIPCGTERGFDKRDQAFDGALCASIEEQSQVCIHRGIMSSMKDTSAATF